MDNDSTNGPYGPFENPDDISKFWYQVEEQSIRENIKYAENDIKDKSNSKEDIEIQKKFLNEEKAELKNLLSFVDDYHRSLERYKYDKKTLERIQADWKEYNLSLWAGYLGIRRMQLDSHLTRGEGLINIQRESKEEKIKREEIERRIRNLLEG